MAKEISLNEIKEDMVLAEPIVNKFGNVLIPAGASLKLSHLQLLKIWNINSIKIIEELSDNLNIISDEQRELARDILKKKILWKARNEWEEDLIELGILSIAKSLNRKKISVEV